MPHLRCRGLTKETVQNIAETLVKEISEITGAPTAHFTVEHVPTEFIPTIYGGANYPFIELFWFKRSQEIQDQVAQCITRIVKAEIGDIGEIAVLVFPLEKTAYYDNGKHYG